MKGTKEEDYHRQIIKIITEIDSIVYLKFIHDLLCAFKRKWGI